MKNNYDITTIYFQMPLYIKIEPSQVALQDIEDFVQQLKDVPESIDAYCIECGKESSFKGVEVKIFADEDDMLPGIFGVHFTCSRNSEHEAIVFFYATTSYIVKIGQYPSLADLKIRENKRFDKVLPNSLRSEFSRAVGLAAHGIGVGSFVYLRRVFEKLVFDTYENEYMSKAFDDKVPREKFYAMRMDEKIQLLRHFLPEFLVENRKIYAILSKGIHELDDQECLEYFDTIRLSIEYILQERASSLEQKQMRARLQKEISHLLSSRQ